MKLDFTGINQPLSSTIHLSGKEYLYFGGTAYLGIPQNDDFIKLYVDGIKKFGLNNGTSRINNIQLGIYNEAEIEAADRFKAEAALITSSGYLAAQLTVKELSNFGSVIYAPSTHPALWQEKQPDEVGTFAGWSKEVVEKINSAPENNWVIISNSMNNLIPEIYDFSFLNEIETSKNIILIVDDSHGIGVNNKGFGAYVKLPKLNNVENVLVASMAKALGVDAGVILGSEKIINQLKSTNTFAGASPPAAAGLYAFLYAKDIYRTAWQKLQQNIILFNDAINVTWKFEQDFPVYFINYPNLATNILKDNILISSFPYPNADSEPLNRIVLSSWHQPEDIKQLISVLK